MTLEVCSRCQELLTEQVRTLRDLTHKTGQLIDLRPGSRGFVAASQDVDRLLTIAQEIRDTYKRHVAVCPTANRARGHAAEGNR